MNVYIFVAAAVLAIIPILVVLKVNIGKLKVNPKSIKQTQKNFFIGVALSKIVPVTLLAFGVIKMTQVTSISKLYIPLVIILILLGLAIYYILSQRRTDVNMDTQVAILTITSMAVPLILTVPVMAIFFLFMMLIY